MSKEESRKSTDRNCLSNLNRASMFAVPWLQRGRQGSNPVCGGNGSSFFGSGKDQIDIMNKRKKGKYKKLDFSNRGCRRVGERLFTGERVPNYVPRGI